MGFVKKVLKGRKGKRGKVDPLGLAVELGAPVRDEDLPRCSIVILNWNGKHHLEPCFETLAALEQHSADAHNAIDLLRSARDAAQQVKAADFVDQGLTGPELGAAIQAAQIERIAGLLD